MNLIADPTPIILHGEYTLLWVFLFGMFSMFWLQVLGMKLAFLSDQLDVMRSKELVESIGGEFVEVENGRAIFKMVSTPSKQSKPAVDSKAGTDTKEG